MDIETLQKQLGARLKALRLEKDLTQEDIENFDFSYRHYGKIERGQVNLTLKTMLNLCKIFEVSLPELFSFTTERETTEEQESIIVRVNKIINCGDEKEVHKLKLFLDEIL